MVAARIPCLLFDPPFELEKISSDVFSVISFPFSWGASVNIRARNEASVNPEKL